MLKSKSILKFILKLIGAILCLLLIVALLLIQSIDRTPYKGSTPYIKMKKTLDSLPLSKSDQIGQLKVGWAKIPIIPTTPIPIASYGIRDKYVGVHDTVWCKTFLFDNGVHRAAFVTLDILIFPPVVLEKIETKLPIAGINESNLYVTTSHTHNGPGGWAKGLGGRFLAGPFNEDYSNQLASTVLNSLKLAEQNLSDASIGYTDINSPEIIENRFSKKAKDIDSKIRVIKIQKQNGSTACLSVYAAHPNTLSSKFNELSGDYPGELTLLLESNNSIDFAAFAAGAVATHNCHFDTLEYSDLTHKVASSLYKKIISNFDSIPLQDSITISALKINVPLRSPQLKVAQNLKIRPWLFYELLGREEVFISQLRVGNVLFIGTPSDFAGGLAIPLYNKAKEKKLNLIITSFNGGYIGYILPDQYYDRDVREPRDMDWYGPNSGSYFSEIITTLINKNQ